MHFSIWEGDQLLEAVQEKQGLSDVESKLGQGHIKHQGMVTKETEQKEGGRRNREERAANLGGLVCFSGMQNAEQLALPVKRTSVC